MQAGAQSPMTFKAYIDNIQAKTGKTPSDFRRMAEQKGFMEGGAIRTGVKAGQVIDWLKADFDLGRGHAMAVYALLKGRKDSPGSAASNSRKKK
jgi:hypothetical protein